MKHENNVTLSIYVKNINCLCYDKETKTVIEKAFTFYNERVPSDNILKKELSDFYNVTVIDILSVTDNNALSGTYKMTHADFLAKAERIGEVRGHKEKTE